MKCRRNGIVILLTGIVVLFVMACSPAPAPTVAPVPTATLVPTTVPATQAPTVAAPAAESGALLDSLNQVKAAKSYRVNLQVTAEGGFAGITGPTPVPGTASTPVTLVQMTGEVNEKDAHFTIQGLFMSNLGIEPDQPFEVISHGGNAYLKGPVPLLGAMEEIWYKAPAQAAGVAQPPLTPGAFLESFGETGINPGDFAKAGTESLDGKTCEIYSGDKSAVVNAFTRLGGASGATQEDLDSIDSAEFKFWVCDDGFLHQVKMGIVGHEKEKPEEKGSFEIFMKISDFNTDIQITPPADAKLLELPDLSTPPAPTTPTNTPTP